MDQAYEVHGCKVHVEEVDNKKSWPESSVYAEPAFWWRRSRCSLADEGDFKRGAIN